MGDDLEAVELFANAKPRKAIGRGQTAAHC